MIKIKRVLLIAGCIFLLTGCGSGNQRAVVNNPQTENSVAEEETELTYNQASIDLLINALSCEDKKAESILRGLGQQNIGNITSAELIDSESEYKVLIEDENEKSYILYIDKKYHLFAIQEDNDEGSYIYRELE